MEQKKLAPTCAEVIKNPWDSQHRNAYALLQCQMDFYTTNTIENCVHGAQVVCTTATGAGSVHIFHDYDQVMPLARLLNANILRLVQTDRLRRGLGVFVHLHRYVPAHVLLAIICQYANISKDGDRDILRPALERLDLAVESGLLGLRRVFRTNPNDTALRTLYEQVILSHVLLRPWSAVIRNGPQQPNLRGRLIWYEPLLPRGDLAWLHFVSDDGQYFSTIKKWIEARYELTNQRPMLAAMKGGKPPLDTELRPPCVQSERLSETGIEGAYASLFRF